MRIPCAAAIAFAVAILISALPAQADDQVLNVAFQSPSLSQFYGKPTYMSATVLLPDSYYKNTSLRYPVVYSVPAFDGGVAINGWTQQAFRKRSYDRRREFITVFLNAMVNENGESLHTQFADSQNDGPWGDAFADEFVAETDDHFRTIPSADARFLIGHSSGGWSVLWLQVNYPDIFGGAWSISPDPVDFHDFLHIDLTKSPLPNFYRSINLGADFSFRLDWVRRQLDTYDEVFSPKGSDGQPQRLFDRKTGEIDPVIASYWEEHWDITHLLEQRWPFIGPKLAGKLHVFVGAQDNFALDGPVRLMQAALKNLGSDAECQIVPGNHWTVFFWHGGLLRYALDEMSSRMDALDSAGNTHPTPR